MASPEWNLTYEQFINTCLDYYGSQEAYSQALAQGISSKDYANIFLKAGYTVEQNLNGDIVYVGPNENTPAVAETVPSTINSNTQQGYTGGGASWSQPVGSTGDGTPNGNVSHTTKDGQPTVRKYKDGKLDTSGGSKILGGAGKVIASYLAYNQGLNLGKKVEKALYEADPDFWDEKGMSTLDPDTWGDIASNIDSPVGKFAFSMLADVTPSESGGAPTTTMYSNDIAQAYFTKWLKSVGFLDSGGEEYTNTVVGNDQTLPNPIISTSVSQSDIPLYNSSTKQSIASGLGDYDGHDLAVRALAGATVKALFYKKAANSNTVFLVVSNQNDIAKSVGYMENGEYHTTIAVGGSLPSYTHDGKTVYYRTIAEKEFNSNSLTGYNTYASIGATAWSMFYGTIETRGKEGVSDQSGANVFDASQYGLTDDSTIEEVLEALKKFNPDAYNNRIEIDIAQPDGSTKTITYWPTATGNGVDENGNPITETVTYTDPDTGEQTEVVPQTQTKVDPETATDTQIATLLKILTQQLTQTGQPQPDPTGLVDPKTQTQTDPDGKTTIKIDLPPNLPPTGTGDTPTVVIPTGNASSLWAIYNPTLAQINSFGAWLWSPNFVDQILKLFSDPMQAIIGLHKIYCTPTTGAEQNIKVGYLDSGVPSKIVTDQYTTVDCGSVNLFEYFGNVFDYAPYTQLRLYLPFIGIVNLDTEDAMRGVIHVVYHVDVLSGACLAEVRITRDAAGGTLYQYAGNAAVTMPISSGSYIGVIANVVGVASSAIGGFASGGVAGGIAGGVTGALTRRGGTQVQHSGNFSGNAGAMGIKKPYLIIERPQTALADNYAEYIGNPSNTTVTLSSCTGYIKMKEVHLENVPATGAELSEIEQTLKQGVII